MNTSGSNTIRTLVLSGILILLIWLLWTIRAMVGPLVIAALAAYLLNPAVSFVEKHTPLRRQYAVYLVYFFFLFSMAAIILSLLPVVARQARSLAAEMPSYLSYLEETFQSIEVFGLALPLDELWHDFNAISTQLMKPDRIFRVIYTATTNLTWLLVILVTTFYLLQDWERLLTWIIQLAPRSFRPDLYRMHREISVIWGAYLRGQLIVMLLLGTFSGLGAAAIGIPRALLLGFLAGLLALFPSIGPTIATIIAALVAWVDGSHYLNLSNLWVTALTVGVFTGVQFIEGIWLQPTIMGNRMRLHPGLVFVALVGALVFGSALLALMIIPLLATCVVIGRYLHHHLLGIEPWSADGIYIPSDMSVELNEKVL
jgi:predicted PurR-regulated permease PerM